MIDEIKTDAGPKEFISLIKHAKLLCTDSFHATCFAINYGVPFYVLNRFADCENRISQNSRIQDLLSTVSLTDRILYDDDFDRISYSYGFTQQQVRNIQMKLSERRLLSDKYLMAGIK